MTIAEFAARLAKAEPRGGYLWIAPDGGLDFVGPRELLTDGVRSFVRERKAEIVAWLRTPIDAQPVEDQRLFDYNPTTPRSWWESDEGWIDARLIWPAGSVAGVAAPEAAQPAAPEKHVNPKRDPKGDAASQQGGLW